MSTVKLAAVQAAPEFMDLDGTIAKTERLIAAAAAQGAQLIAFPECWVPGYPWWIWLSAPAGNLRYFRQYHENSLVAGSAAMQRVADAARAHDIFVSLGASERDHGSLYIAQFLFSNEGELLSARRKLKPTHVERTVFGDGDGSDLVVVQTCIGRIGQLNCWEHLQPLSKYAMYSMHEQIHVAAWPTFSCYPQAYALSAPLNNAASQIYAAEGQCFVVAPCGVLSATMIEALVETEQQAALISQGGGAARIFGPDGAPMCEPIAQDAEGLLFAECDLGAIAVAKSFADPVGHYARPDVTRLLLDRRSRRPVVEAAEQQKQPHADAADAGTSDVAAADGAS